MLRSWSISALIFYKRFISRLLPRSCRFSPTCSEYSRLAIQKYGFFKGCLLTLKRLFRCQPFFPGGIDIP